MKLSISNIGWVENNDQEVYDIMKKTGFSGLEIAPTRVFSETPYEKLGVALKWKDSLLERYGFVIPSMQSIWYGRTENIFASNEERQSLIDYTKKAIDFAEQIGCKNLVFGCPKNRNVPEGKSPDVAMEFLKEIGDYSLLHNCVFAVEANPAIYNTNYLNNTLDALQLLEEINNEGVKLNLDVGTMVENGESVALLKGRERFIHHVHISEPGLKPIQQRAIHGELADYLKDINYDGFVSVEVGRQDTLQDLITIMNYVKEIFG